ncbi:3-hydroxyacyl-ACP dehydratase FabZ [Mycoplasmatota bacterium WC44]
MLNKEEIKKVIPHRHEMLLIDKVLEVVPGESATAELYCKEDSWFFKGHFPNYPVTPGVLMVEALAQTAAVSFLLLEENKGKIGFFAGINNCKFKKQVKPGDVLTLKIQTLKSRGAISVVDAKAYVDGKLAVKAELTLAVDNG